jgi:hypothetical protein
MFDVIGDVHGHADELEDLLARLGYDASGGAFRHPSRTAVFLGDWIDRGPRIARTLEIVRGMVDHGAARAVIGNHELNALAWATPRSPVQPPRDAQDWCRAHTPKNQRIHQRTVEQLTPPQLERWLDWFRTLPWWLDLGGLRCVHACWDAAAMRDLVAAFGANWITSAEVVRAAHRPGSREAAAAERILKGPEIPLPEGRTLPDPEGFQRRVMRTRWFGAQSARTYADIAFPGREGMPQDPLPADGAAPPPLYGAEEPPVIIGHYWIPGAHPAEPLAPNVACVDYSVARGGRLMAYRWSGERRLCAANFVSVPWRPRDGSARRGDASHSR